MWLKVVGNSAALDAKGAVGRTSGIDKIAFEHDRVVARTREGERGRKSRDTTPGDDELHNGKLSSGKAIQGYPRKSYPAEKLSRSKAIRPPVNASFIDRVNCGPHLETVG